MSKFVPILNTKLGFEMKLEEEITKIVRDYGLDVRIGNKLYYDTDKYIKKIMEVINEFKE